MKKIILIGGGGHCKVVIDAILLKKEFEIVGIIDLKEKVGKKVLGIPIIGVDNDLEKYFQMKIKACFITVGTIGDASLRIKLFNKARKIGFRFFNVIHPNSTVSKFARLGEGNYIAALAVINAGTIVGDNCIINTGAVIEHDCFIDDFVHIAPGAMVSGGTTIGKCTHIGVGSSVVQSVKIGRNSIIGAGSVVVDNIPDHVVAYGNPCRVVSQN